jgi:hypothetical protein
MEHPNPPAGPDHSAYGTAAILIIGLLILVPSGLCTGIVGGGALLSMLLHPQSPSDQAYGPLLTVGALICGTPFIVIGGLLVWSGVKRIRSK